MAEEVLIVLIAGVVALGLIVVARAIITGLAISRRASHHLAQESGTRPVPPAAQVPPSMQ